MTVGELKIKLSADAGEMEKGIEGAKTALESMEQSGEKTAERIISAAKVIAEGIKSQSPQIEQAGQMMFGALDDALPGVTEEIIASSGSMIESVIGSLAGYKGDMEGIGADLMDGMGAGIMQSSSALKEQIQSMGQSVLTEIKNVFEIASPSKKTAYFGQMIGEGLASGIAESIGKVNMASQSMFSAATQDAGASNYTYNTYNSTYNANSGINDNVKMADFENRLRRAYG